GREGGRGPVRARGEPARHVARRALDRARGAGDRHPRRGATVPLRSSGAGAGRAAHRRELLRAGGAGDAHRTQLVGPDDDGWTASRRERVRQPWQRSVAALLPSQHHDRIPRQPEESGCDDHLYGRRTDAPNGDCHHLREAVNPMRARSRVHFLDRLSSAGFTLVEMLVTLLIFSVVAVTLTLVIMRDRKSKQRTSQRIESEQG